MEMASREAYLREIEKGLHDLCQPVTSLQCQLELGKMAGDREALLEAVEGGLLETRRIFADIERFRQCLQSLTVHEQEPTASPAEARDGRDSVD
jgi:hypothetical protein